ncbi:serine hydrolase domain-containing protein [Pseudonocardia ammonioxydans]|nr:serine hydrolase domain-containing protein [Pseudonocardia ammonioxydans]
MTFSRPRRLFAVALCAAVALTVAGCAAGPAAPPPQPPPPAATAPLTPADVTTWLDGLVPAMLDRTGIPGAAVSVVRDGQVIAARGYGVATAGDPATGEPARPVDAADTLFRTGSVSKVATAVAVLQQVEQGRIDLDADVRGYLDFPLPLRFDPPVTMRHLLSHTAGFEERIRGVLGTGDPAPLRETLATDPPEQVFAPGTTPAYSNYGYGLAGYVVERVTGEPFERYVQRAVLDRAGMTSSTFAQPLPEPLAGRMADGFATAGGPAQPFEVVQPAPAGSLSAPATDLARLASALLGTGPRLLAPETVALMRAPALGPDSLGELAAGPRMGLGLFEEDRNGHEIRGHGGDTRSFHSHLQLVPDQRLGVFVTANGSGAGTQDFLQLTRSVVHGVVDRYVPGTPQPVPAAAPEAADPDAADPDAATPDATAPDAVDPDPAGRAAAVAGRYESARAPFSTFLEVVNLVGQVTVTDRPDGTLAVSPGVGGVAPTEFYRESRPGVWQQIGGTGRITTRTDGGTVTALGTDPASTLLRVSPARDSAVVLPVLAAAVVLLLAGLLAVPVDALARRRYAAAAPVSPGPLDRTAQWLTRTAAACALVALAGWSAVIGAILGLTDVPAAALHTLQALQWFSVGGLLAAVVALVTGVRGGIGRSRIAGRVLMLLGLAGTTWVAVAFGLLSLDVSY